MSEPTRFLPREKSTNGDPDATARRGALGPLSALRSNRTLALAIVRFSVLCHAAMLLLLAGLYLPAETARWIEISAYSSAALVLLLVLFLSNLRLFRTAGGAASASVSASASGSTSAASASASASGSTAADAGLRTANKLTLLRFVMVAPMVCVIADSHLVAGVVLYTASGITDVADGYIARRRCDETQFGVMMDPAADVLTTAGVFGALFARGLVPWWVAALLLVRYASLGVGSLLLTLLVGPIVYKATITGKIVGVLQAAAVILILVLTAANVAWQDRLGAFLYPFLASIFAWVIVSKLVIAVRHIRGGPSHVRSQGGSGRFSADTGDADAQPRRGDG